MTSNTQQVFDRQVVVPTFEGAQSTRDGQPYFAAHHAVRIEAGRSSLECAHDAPHSTLSTRCQQRHQCMYIIEGVVARLIESFPRVGYLGPSLTDIHSTQTQAPQERGGIDH